MMPKAAKSCDFPENFDKEQIPNFPVSKTSDYGMSQFVCSAFTFGFPGLRRCDDGPKDIPETVFRVEAPEYWSIGHERQDYGH
jgi:hypothetical protein